MGITLKQILIFLNTQGHKLTQEEIDFWNANKLSRCSYTREDYKYYNKDPFIQESKCVWDVHLDYQNSVAIIKSKTAFNLKNKKYYV